MITLNDLTQTLSPRSIYALVYNSFNDSIGFNLSSDDVANKCFIYGDRKVKKIEFMEVNRRNTIVIFLERDSETAEREREE